MARRKNFNQKLRVKKRILFRTRGSEQNSQKIIFSTIIYPKKIRKSIFIGRDLTFCYMSCFACKKYIRTSIFAAQIKLVRLGGMQ